MKVIDVAAIDERTQGKGHGSELPRSRGIGQSIAYEQSAGVAVKDKRAQKDNFLVIFAAQAESSSYTVVSAGEFPECTPAFWIDNAGMQAAGKGNIMAVDGNGVFYRGQKHVFS